MLFYFINLPNKFSGDYLCLDFLFNMLSLQIPAPQHQSNSKFLKWLKKSPKYLRARTKNQVLSFRTIDRDSRIFIKALCFSYCISAQYLLSPSNIPRIEYKKSTCVLFIRPVI